MAFYLIKRILLILPTLVVVSLLAFFIQIAGLYHPFDDLYARERLRAGEKELKEKIEKRAYMFNLDKPPFYFSIQSMGGPDSLYRILNRSEREVARRWYFDHGHWEAIEAYRKAAKTWKSDLYVQSGDKEWRKLYPLIRRLLEFSSLNEGYWEQLREATAERAGEVDRIADLYHEFSSLRPSWTFYLPSLTWQGWENRYHLWLKGILTEGNFGYSILDREPVGENWDYFVGMTLRFTLLSVFFAYLLSLGLGTWMAVKEGSRGEKFLDRLLLFVDAIPIFWLATLLLLFFANPHFLDLFPATYRPDEDSLLREMSSMVMPLAAYVLGMLTLLTRLMKSSMVRVLGEDYIRTAFAKGLPPWRIYLVHALRNALIPMIAGLAGIFVLLLGGSVIVEQIFSIPGMGDKVLKGVGSGDTPQILMIICLTGLFTALGYLLSDLLYSWADPRIRLERREK